MGNPLLSGTQTQTQMPNLSGFQQLANMLKSAQNPSAALNMLAQKNPQMQQIMQMCSGKNPKDVFIAECQRRGIDPAQAMQQMGLK